MSSRKLSRLWAKEGLQFLRPLVRADPLPTTVGIRDIVDCLESVDGFED
jgi:hypothetical protein